MMITLFAKNRLCLGPLLGGLLFCSNPLCRAEESSEELSAPATTLAQTESFADGQIRHAGEWIRQTAQMLSDTVGGISPWFADVLEAKIFGVPFILLASATLVLLLTWLAQKYFAPAMTRIAVLLFPYRGEQVCIKIISSIGVPARLLIASFGVALACQLCVTNDEMLFLLGKLLWAFVLGMLIWVSCLVADFIFDLVFGRLSERSGIAKNVHSIAKKVFNVVYLILCVILVLDIYGFNVSAIVASLGIGGAAIAFASQSTVANFFGSFSIAAENPFSAGEWVKIGDEIEGFVKEIGVRSTKIETLDNTILVVPNSTISESRIDNLSRCERRGDNISFVLDYAVSPEKVRELICKIKELLDDTPGISSEDQNVVFSEYSPCGIKFLIEYNTYETDRVGLIQMRNEINIAILEIVKSCGCKFALPQVVMEDQ